MHSVYFTFYHKLKKNLPKETGYFWASKFALQRMDGKQKKIGDRITFEKNVDFIEISISQRAKQWQEILLVAWTGVWLFCGFLIIGQLLITTDVNQRTFLSIFMGVWGFVLFKALKVLVWRILGSEEIMFSEGVFKYKRSFAGLGRVRKAKVTEISKVEVIKYSDRSFKKNMESYFWNIGAESIGLQSSKRYFLVAVQLDEKSSKLLFDLLKDSIKRF